MLREWENDNHLRRARYLEVGDQLLVLKVPEFFFSEQEVETMIGKARKHQNLIVDLRGNPGGAVDTLKYLVGGIFVTLSAEDAGKAFPYEWAPE